MTQTEERLFLWIETATLNAIGWLFGIISRIMADWLIKNFDLILRPNSLSPSTWAFVQIMIWLLAGCFAGYTLGVFQTGAPSARDFRSNRWPIATMLGLGAGFIGYGYSSLVSNHLETTVFFGIFGALVGGLAGWMQWLILRRRYSQAVWWIPASMIIWALGFFSVFKVQVGLLSAISLPIVSALTSVVLLWLLRHPIQLQPAEALVP